MNMKPFILHALSPLHAETGHTLDVIDLPIARMKATGIPIVPGSSIKGVLRDIREEADPTPDKGKTKAVFGPGPKDDSRDHAGALTVGTRGFWPFRYGVSRTHLSGPPVPCCCFWPGVTWVTVPRSGRFLPWRSERRSWPM